jgi:hypothetical protein
MHSGRLPKSLKSDWRQVTRNTGAKGRFVAKEFAQESTEHQHFPVTCHCLPVTPVKSGPPRFHEQGPG